MLTGVSAARSFVVGRHERGAREEGVQLNVSAYIGADTGEQCIPPYLTTLGTIQQHSLIITTSRRVTLVV